MNQSSLFELVDLEYSICLKCKTQSFLVCIYSYPLVFMEENTGIPCMYIQLSLGIHGGLVLGPLVDTQICGCPSPLHEMG